MAGRTATFSLLPSIKRDWVKALRSGKYKQGVDTLYSPERKTYCCLGVLCEVMGVKTGKLANHGLPQDVGIGTDITPEYHEMPSYAVYSNRAFAWSVKYKNRLTPLATINDEHYLDFNQIADLIEKNVPTHRR